MRWAWCHSHPHRRLDYARNPHVLALDDRVRIRDERIGVFRERREVEAFLAEDDELE